MKSKKYIIFTHGYEGGPLFGSETITGPEKDCLVMEGFFGFYLQRIADRYAKYVVFAAPATIDTDPTELWNKPVVIRFWATENDLPRFDKIRILDKMFLGVEVEEIFDLDLVKFERIYKI